MEMDEGAPRTTEQMEESEDSEAVSTDRDQDDVLEASSDSADDSEELKIDDVEMFAPASATNSTPLQRSAAMMQIYPHDKRIRSAYHAEETRTHKLTKSKLESTINKSLLRNPGELVSDFYISNMNYAMKYSVEYVQSVAKEKRRQLEQNDSFFNLDSSTFSSSAAPRIISPRLYRSISVDMLYDVRRENIRYVNGADERTSRLSGANCANSFTTDDIQDIYMPSAIENYKRKIAVELERRRRCVESTLVAGTENSTMDEFSPVRAPPPQPPSRYYALPPPTDYQLKQTQIVLDDLDIFIIKKSRVSVVDRSASMLTDNTVVKSYQPVIECAPPTTSTSQSDILKSRMPQVYKRENITIQKTTTEANKYAVASQIEPGVSLSRAHITQPTHVHQQPPGYRRQSVQELERVRVIEETESSAVNYAVVNNVVPIVDAEVICVQQQQQQRQQESSLAEDRLSSTSASITEDSFTNLNLDAFEPVTSTQREIVRVDRAREEQAIAETNLAYGKVIEHPPLIQDASGPVRIPVKITAQNGQVLLDQAKTNIEPTVKQPVLTTSHPPKIVVDPATPPTTTTTTTTQRINVEVFSTSQEVNHQSVLTNIRPERLKKDKIDSIHYEPLRKPLNKVSIHKLNALNLASNEQVDDEEQPNTIGALNKEKLESVQVDELSTRDKVEEKRVSVLNAPMSVDEHVPGIELVPTAISRTALVAPELVAQESIRHQELNSTEVIPLEHSRELPPGERLAPQKATLADEQYELARVDSKQKPLTLNSAVVLEQDASHLLPPPDQFQVPNPVATDRVETSSVVGEREPLLQLSHVVVPVDIKSARLNEYDNHEQKVVEFSVDEADRQNADILVPKQEDYFEMARASVSKPFDLARPVVKDIEMEKTEAFQVSEVNVENLDLRETDQAEEVDKAAKCTKANVYNLANVTESTHESNYAHPITIANEIENQSTAEVVSTPQLVDKASKFVYSILNRAREETETRELDSSEDMLERSRADEVAQEQVEEENTARLKSTVSSALTLNAPKTDTAFVEEQNVDELDHKHDEQVDLDVPNVHVEKEADLAKPVLKKPILLSKALLNETEVQEERASKFDVEKAPEEEIVEVRQEEEIKSGENEVVATRPRAVSLGALVDEAIPADRAHEIETARETGEAAHEARQDEFGLEKADLKPPLDVRNSAMISTSKEEFEFESVKPMDTIELNFQEVIGTISTHKSDLKSPDGVNKTTIDQIGFAKVESLRSSIEEPLDISDEDDRTAAEEDIEPLQAVDRVEPKSDGLILSRPVTREVEQETVSEYYGGDEERGIRKEKALEETTTTTPADELITQSVRKSQVSVLNAPIIPIEEYVAESDIAEEDVETSTEQLLKVNMSVLSDELVEDSIYTKKPNTD